MTIRSLPYTFVLELERVDIHAGWCMLQIATIFHGIDANGDGEAERPDSGRSEECEVSERGF